MAKILFVGDVHLKGSTPISRKDNYSETILKKLEWVHSYADSIDCKDIIFLGDIFDTVNTSLQYFSLCLSTFKKIADSGINLYTIVGNHDIKYDSIDTLPITPLGILIKSNIINMLEDLYIEDVYIKGVQYTEHPSRNLSDKSYFSIMVAHRFYESAFNEEPISKHNLVDWCFDTYILGHDHRPYLTVELEEEGKHISLFRPGSLARNSSDQYNRLRKPRVLVFDTLSKYFYYEEVPSESGIDVFFDRVKEEKLPSMSELVLYLKESYHTADTSIRDYVNNADMPDKTKSLVISYLDMLGA